MAMKGKGAAATEHQPGAPKKTRQGMSLRTHLGASSRNGRGKRYKGQGK
jgi:hypothetical protein